MLHITHSVGASSVALKGFIDPIRFSRSTAVE
jgi:hypothetical protein